MASRVQIAAPTSHGATELSGVRKCSRSKTCGMRQTASTHRAWINQAAPSSTATTTSFMPLHHPLEEPDHDERGHERRHRVHEREVEVDRAVESLGDHEEREARDGRGELQAEEAVDARA